MLLFTPLTFHCFSFQGTTTPDYDEFEEYVENTFDPNTQEREDDYPLTGRNPKFQPAPADGDRSSFLLPQNHHGSDNIPLTFEPVYGFEPPERQYASPNPPQTVAEGGAQQPQEQQPQVTLKNRASGSNVQRTVV